MILSWGTVPFSVPVVPSCLITPLSNKNLSAAIAVFGHNTPPPFRFLWRQYIFSLKMSNHPTLTARDESEEPEDKVEERPGEDIREYEKK